MRRALRGLLEMRETWTVCGEAVNADDAIGGALRLRPDIIILDFAMGAVDGITAAREILAILPTIPIVMYTLFDSPALEAEAKKAGVRQVIGKADGIRLLIAAVETELGECGAFSSESADHQATRRATLIL
jgi:DNA-binding NarL/FixJ family response regulator